MIYTVIRQHLGDKMYFPDEKRELAESEATTLLKQGIIAKIKESPKTKDVKQAPKTK